MFFVSRMGLRAEPCELSPEPARRGAFRSPVGPFHRLVEGVRHRPLEGWGAVLTTKKNQSLPSVRGLSRLAFELSAGTAGFHLEQGGETGCIGLFLGGRCWALRTRLGWRCPRRPVYQCTATVLVRQQRW